MRYMGEKSFNCQMDITFAHTRDGRPELYDFLWEHVPHLMQNLNEKKIRVLLQPPRRVETWSKRSGMTQREVEHAIQKVVNDKRFSKEAKLVDGESPSLEMNVRAEQLDNVLNAYNILFEKFLPHLILEGTNIRVDFSPAEKNAVKCFSSSEQKPLINTFLVRNLKQAPRVRSIVYASLAERRRGR